MGVYFMNGNNVAVKAQRQISSGITEDRTFYIWDSTLGYQPLTAETSLAFADANPLVKFVFEKAIGFSSMRNFLTTSTRKGAHTDVRKMQRMLEQNPQVKSFFDIQVWEGLRRLGGVNPWEGDAQIQQQSDNGSSEYPVRNTTQPERRENYGHIDSVFYEASPTWTGINGNQSVVYIEMSGGQILREVLVEQGDPNKGTIKIIKEESGGVEHYRRELEQVGVVEKPKAEYLDASSAFDSNNELNDHGKAVLDAILNNYKGDFYNNPDNVQATITAGTAANYSVKVLRASRIRKYLRENGFNNNINVEYDDSSYDFKIETYEFSE